MDEDRERDFEDFVRQRGPALLRTAYLLTGDRGQAEDLLQDVLARASTKWGRISLTAEPVAYVRRSLTNASTSRWRRLRARVREVPLEQGAEPVGPSPHPAQADATRTVDQRDELARALARVSPRQRAVLVLRYWEDLPEAEIAAILDCSVGAVKTHASRGLTRMRELLGPADLDLVPAGAGGPSTRHALATWSTR